MPPHKPIGQPGFLSSLSPEETDMIPTDFWYWLAFVPLLLLWCWLLIGKIRASALSGFRFYWIAGLLQAVPFFVSAILFIFFPRFGIGWFLVVALIPSMLSQRWERSQEKKAEQAEPSRWEAWESKRAQQRFWSRLFL
jgi:hypothetical protein